VQDYMIMAVLLDCVTCDTWD